MQCNSDPRGTPELRVRYSNAGRVCHHPRGSRIESAIARSHSSQVKEIMSLDPRRYGRGWVVGPDSVWTTRGEPRTITRNKATRHWRGEACGSYPKVACPALQSVIRAKLSMWRGLCRRHPERPRRSGDKTSLPSYIKIAKMLALQTRKNGCIGLSQAALLWDIWREPAAGATATERIDHGAAARPSAFGCLRRRVQ
jgi:hypothetical protein